MGCCPYDPYNLCTVLLLPLDNFIDERPIEPSKRPLGVKSLNSRVIKLRVAFYLHVNLLEIPYCLRLVSKADDLPKVDEISFIIQEL